MRSHKPLYITVIILFVFLNGIAQNMKTIDSLKAIVQQGPMDNKIAAYNLLGWEYRKIYPDSSIYFLQSGIELMDLQGVDSLKPETYNFIGVAYLYKGDYLTSYDYHEKAKELAEMNKDSLQLGHALNSMGRLYEGTAAYDKAIDYYNQALEIFKNLDDPIGLSYIYSSLATFYQSQKAFIKAEEMCKKSLHIRLELKNRVGTAFSYLELAKIYGDANKKELAFETLKKAQIYSDSVQDYMVLKAEVNTQIADQYRQRKDYAEAQKLLDIAMQIAEDVANYNLKIKVYIGQAKLYSDLKSYDNAIRLYQETIEFAEKSAFWRELKTAYKDLAKNYEYKGDIKKSYEYFKKYNEIEIKFSDVEKARLVQQNESRLALQARAKENELLKIEKQKNEQLLEEENNRKLVLIALVIVMMALLITLFVNATKRKRDNEKLKNQKDELSAINLQKDTLMNILAHDLKAPFNRILGLVDLIKVDNENAASYVEMIDDMSHSGIKLIKEILDVNKLEAGVTEENVVPVDIESMLQHKVVHYSDDASKKNININLSFEAKDYFVTNPLYLERIIDNLISNAVKYSPPGKHIDIIVNSKNKGLHVAVKDEGPGFTEQDKKHLYTKFRTLSAKPTGGEASNGLGLSLVKTLIEKLKGTIDLESEIGKGSIFKVFIPQYN